MDEIVVPMSVFTDDGWTVAARDEFLRPDTDDGGARRAADAVSRSRPGDRRQLCRTHGRRDRRADHLRGSSRGARARAEDAPRRLRLRGRRAGAHGPRPGARHEQGARANRDLARRRRPLRAERAVRRAGADLVRRSRRRARRPAAQPLRRRDRLRPPAGRDRRSADGAARPRFPRPARRPLRA